MPRSGDAERLLSLKNVGVSYQRRGRFWRQPEFWALKDISFDLLHGETLGIIGRNGAGKSTLLRLLAGIIMPDVGTMIRSCAHVSLLTLQAGFVPQLTGRENAVLSGMLLGMRRKVVEVQMDEIISFAELEEFIDQPISVYSTGMRARLGFSVAFQLDPDILLIDEVLGVGDSEFRKKSAAAMQNKIRSNKTVVLVSHNPETIRNLCDRAVLIDKGCSVAEGPPNMVLNKYNESTAQSTTGRTTE